MKIARSLVAALVISSTVACGGAGKTENPSEKETRAAPAPEPEPASAVEAEATLCDLVPQEDVSSAFVAKLTVTGIDTAQEIICVYNLGSTTEQQVEGATLTFHKFPSAIYHSQKKSAEGRDTYEALPGVGLEAHVLSQTQVNVLIDDATTIRVGIVLDTMRQESPLTKEEIRSGIVALATELADKFA